MKIAYLISNYFPNMGGAQTCIHNLARRLTMLGHEAKVVTPKPSSFISTDVSGFGYGLIYINPLIVKMLYKISTLGRFYLERSVDEIQKENRFDLWQVTVGHPLGTAIIDYFGRNRIPSVLRCSGEDLQVNPQIKYGYRLNKRVDALVRNAYPKFDAVVAMTEGLRKDFLEIGVADGKIHLIPNAVDYEAFNLAFSRQDTRAKLGLGKKDRLIISVGRNHPKKGYSLIPRIIKLLLNESKDFRWLIVGKGSQEVKSLADREGVGNFLIAKEVGIEFSKSLEFMIPSKELIEYYRSSDVFVFPTIVEGFPNVIIEAMAAGLPIVSTDASGIRDILSNGRNGLISSVNREQELAGLILSLFRNNTLAETLRDNALQDVRDYGWDKVSMQYLDLYQEVIRHQEKNAARH